MQRMYRDIQEPMLNAAQEQFGSNPFQALSGNNSQNSGSTSGTGENAAPMPNPWGGNSQSSTNNAPATTSSSTSSTGSTLYSSPGMQSLLQQMQENPQLMSNMINAPYTRNLMESLASNPDMAANIISANPLFAGRL